RAGARPPASGRRHGPCGPRGRDIGWDEGAVSLAGLGPVPLVLAMAVLSLLRSAVGAPQVPPTQVLTGLALVLTFAVMAPTGERMFAAAAPALPALGKATGASGAGGAAVDAIEAVVERAKEPLRAFLLAHTAP